MESEPNKAEGGDLEQLTAQLAEMGRWFEKANSRILDYLVRRDQQRAASAPVPSADLAAQISQLAARVEQLAGVLPAAQPPASPPPVGAAAELAGDLLRAIRDKLEILDQQNTALYQTMEQLQAQLDGGVQTLAVMLDRKPQEEQASTVTGDWLTAILGPQLAAQGDAGRRLLEDVLAGDDAAQGLAGQLLVFRSSTPERLPQTLKELGEAYYRWRPKTTPGNDPFEETLAGYLQRACETAGIHNSIELVHPGQRFDAARHNAGSRGVEIVEVLGWIVLRDNGKVYTKATVEVR